MKSKSDSASTQQEGQVTVKPGTAETTIKDSAPQPDQGKSQAGSENKSDSSGTEQEAAATSTASNTASKAGASDSNDSQDAGKPEKKPFWTWDRTIDVAKLLATVWVAVFGSWVTSQFNERQHELSRLEAISKMLPHISSSATDSSGGTKDDMSRDGAIWAIFRTANNRTMLRDLAALFPRDIYRVVSSIAMGGELDHDADAITALQVASEKLAAQYSLDPKRAELARLLYAQALKLKQRAPDDPNPLHVVDITGQEAVNGPSDDQLADLIKSINDLADSHCKESGTGGVKKKSGSNHWEAKSLYIRARKLGEGNEDSQVLQQVERADLSLAQLYVSEKLADDAFKYLKEALAAEDKITKTKGSEKELKAIDSDGDGFADISELAQGINRTEARFKQIVSQYRDKGAELK